MTILTYTQVCDHVTTQHIATIELFPKWTLRCPQIPGKSVFAVIYLCKNCRPASKVGARRRTCLPTDQKMKVKATLSQLISDFAGMSKTPDFKPKREGSLSPDREPSPKAPTQRRHSLNITVGATELPRSKTRRNSISVSGTEEEEPTPKYDHTKRRQSAPCLRTDRSAELKKKLENLKLKKTHSDDDIQEEEEE